MQTSVNSSLKPMVQPFLGISAKSSNAKVSKPKPQTAMESKKLRYTLQRTAQSLLYDRNALKQHRVCSCHRNVASDGVSLWRKTDGSNARFGNLISCGSVWSCPVCASKITESRREDMQKAQTAWILDGGSCLLMTLTFPHAADMPLAELLEKFSKALDHYKNSRTYKRIFGTATALVAQNARKNKPMKNVVEGEFQRLGTVRSMEVSHGENGWHPHVHEVLFMGDDELLNSTRAKDELTQQWVESLLKSGLGSRDQLSDMYQYAFDIRGGDYVSDYINKFGREPVKLNGWSIAHEVTKSNSKLGKQGRQIGKEFHYTPFQLLGFATDGDEVAAALFKEFSKCFEGKRMNYWTNGLKEWFSINETEDEDLAIESDSPEEPKEELVARIDTFQWQNVLKTNTRAELLIATAKGIDAVNEFLQTLATRPKTHSGLFLDRARPDINRFFH